MSAPSESLTKDPAWLYQNIVTRLERLKDTALEQRVNRHIHAKAGYKSLKAFNLSAHLSQRKEIYDELLSAMLRNDFTQLLGQESIQPAKCQAEVMVDGQVVASQDADQALSTLIALLTAPGVTATVKVQVTINHPQQSEIDDAAALKG